jgi:hypothetical protein
MKTNHLFWMLCVLVVVIFHGETAAQAQASSRTHLMKEDSAALNALVMYPDTIRLHIFEACEYPSAIVSIASLQKNSSDEFVALIGSYSKSEQEDFWNLSRYPGLISRLVQEGKESVDAINNIVKDYPAEIHETAIKYGMGYYPALQKMDAIQAKTDSQFDTILADYPPETQAALRVLIQFPEIINLLNDHLGLTVRVGDRYRRNPDAVIHRADSLNLAETRQNASDAEAWKQTIEQSPDEATDLQSAASDYATENGYSEQDVNTAPDPTYVETYVCYPYPYWFGYPTWYPYDYWYPYPYWFDCGFYHNRHGDIVVIGPPSRYFTNWYFYSPEHIRRYPHLADGYIDHYGEGRRSAGGNSAIVHQWVHDHRDYLPPDFATNRPRRTEVIRQVGALDVDAQKQNGGRQLTPAVRDQYLHNNTAKFPSLNTEPRKRTLPEEPSAPSVIQEPTRQPSIRISVPDQPRVTDSKETNEPPVTGERMRPQPSTQQPVRVATPVPTPAFTPRQPSSSPGINFNTIHNAQEYQRNIWEQTAPRPEQQAPRQQVSQPQPRTQQPVRQAPVSQPTRTRDK